MNKNMHRATLMPDVALAGLLAGGTEMIWIAIMALLIPIDGWETSRQISASFVVLPATAAAIVGIVIHLMLSLLLTAVFFPLWRRVALHSRGYGVLFAVALLSLVWAINFLWLLPMVNPYFVTALPLPLTWASKALFGIVMAFALQRTLDRSIA